MQKRQSAHGNVVQAFEEDQKNRIQQLEAQELKINSKLKDLEEQKEAFDKDQDRLVEEWDSLEQMTSEFNQESTAKEAEQEVRENKLLQIQQQNEAEGHQLAAWSHRLAEQKRSLAVRQAGLSRELGKIKQVSAQLSAEKGRLVRKSTEVHTEKKRLARKGQEIKKLAKKFISLTQD